MCRRKILGIEKPADFEGRTLAARRVHRPHACFRSLPNSTASTGQSRAAENHGPNLQEAMLIRRADIDGAFGVAPSQAGSTCRKPSGTPKKTITWFKFEELRHGLLFQRSDGSRSRSGDNRCRRGLVRAGTRDAGNRPKDQDVAMEGRGRRDNLVRRGQRACALTLPWTQPDETHPKPRQSAWVDLVDERLTRSIRIVAKGTAGTPARGLGKSSSQLPAPWKSGLRCSEGSWN